MVAPREPSASSLRERAERAVETADGIICAALAARNEESLRLASEGLQKAGRAAFIMADSERDSGENADDVTAAAMLAQEAESILTSARALLPDDAPSATEPKPRHPPRVPRGP